MTKYSAKVIRNTLNSLAWSGKEQLGHSAKDILSPIEENEKIRVC